MVALFFISWGRATLFSTKAEPCYIPASGVTGFQFLHILTSRGSFLPFVIVTLTSMRWHLTLLTCLFLMIKWCWVSFHVPVGLLYFFFGKVSIQFFCSFFKIKEFSVLKLILKFSKIFRVLTEMCIYQIKTTLSLHCFTLLNFKRKNSKRSYRITELK